MKNLFLLSVLGLGLISCSSTKNMDSDISDISWISESEKACDSKVYICAVGFDKDENVADIRAKQNIASYFSTTVSSDFQYSKQMSASDQGIIETASKKVSESVNEKLKAVIIAKRTQKAGKYYALAQVKKELLSNELRADIRAYDSQLKTLKAQGNRTNIPKMKDLMAVRHLLNKKFIIVSGYKIPEKVSYEDVFNLRNAKMGGEKIHIKYTKNFPFSLKKHLEAMLTQTGLRVVGEQGADYTLKAQYQARKEFINVKGFEKYTHTLSLSTIDGKSNNIGTLNVANTATGRSRADSFLKAQNYLMKKIDNNFENLNIK